jgi:regulator of sirC expression with transglutaminase-like and TPR domain
MTTGVHRATLLDGLAAIQTDADPSADPKRTVDTIRTWGSELQRRLASDMAAAHRLRMLHYFYFVELGFTGDVSTYDSADNSYLNRVLEKRSGIPISLSIVYLEIAAAIGLKADGISFPGHFLVKVAMPEGTLLVDVFDRGALLSEPQLRRRLHAALGGQPAQPLPHYLRAATDTDILVRWLNNLKAIHLASENWRQLLAVADRLVAARPDAADEHLVRALAYERLGCPRAAAGDLATCLQLAPVSADDPAMRARLARLQRAASALH